MDEYVKVTVLLICTICTVHRFFFLKFFPNHWFVLFFLQYFCIVHTLSSLSIYSSILVSHFFFFNLKFWIVATVPNDTVATVDNFFLVFCLYIYFFPFIYITVNPVFLPCACTIDASVLWFRDFFFFVSTLLFIQLAAIMPKVFFFFFK